jgi:hypothetical protein
MRKMPEKSNVANYCAQVIGTKKTFSPNQNVNIPDSCPAREFFRALKDTSSHPLLLKIIACTMPSLDKGKSTFQEEFTLILIRPFGKFGARGRLVG